MPSTAKRAAKIRGVVPSCIRASRSVALFLIRICHNKSQSTGNTNVRRDRQQTLQVPRSQDLQPPFQRPVPPVLAPSPGLGIRGQLQGCCFAVPYPETTRASVFKTFTPHLARASWRPCDKLNCVTDSTCSTSTFPRKPRDWWRKDQLPGRLLGHRQRRRRGGASCPCYLGCLRRH